MKSYPVFILITVAFFGLVLFWIAMARYDEFTRHHETVARQATSGVADEIARFIVNKQRLVKLFSQEQRPLLIQLIKQPDSDLYQQQISDKLREYFPGYFSYTIADFQGRPYIDDFDGQINMLCQMDIVDFALNDIQSPRLHPHPFMYHFDIMAKMADAATNHILFVSFSADLLGDLINNVQPANHELILLLPGATPLIEITANGPRNNLVREDFHLTSDETKRVLSVHHVSGTQWEIAALYRANLFGNFQRRLVLQSLMIFVPFMVFASIMLYLFKRTERLRQQAEVARDEFLATVSHELRTPLTAIHGSLGLIAGGISGQLSAKTTELIDIARKNSQRLILLVNDLLDMRKLESGKMDFDMQPINLIDVILHAIEENREYARQFNVVYAFNPEQREILLHADKNRLFQVMTNLLTNAAKYGNRNDTVQINVTPSEQNVRVSVEDKGPGIPPEFKDRVFEKFSQSDSSDSRSAGGYGLGLSIVMAIIEAHGGNVGFQSQKDLGTKFYFDLPSYQPA
jgi:signal transduction histidine kinase